MKTVIRPETEMKDSGIDTVEKMPLSWNKIRLKNLVKIRTGNEDTKNATPNGKYRFYVRSPIVERCDRYTFEGEAILVAGDGAGAGRIFHLVDGRYAVHQRVYCLSDFKYNAKFIHYYLGNLFPFEMDKGSAQSTVPSMRLPMLLNFKLVLPGENECLKIIDYLDETCSKIDEIIAEAKASIDEYKELKQSILCDAVLRGLNSQVALKNSGALWIGMIPEHWQTSKLKWHLRRMDPKNPGEKEVLSLYRDYGVIPKNSRTDNHNVTSEDTSKYKYVKIGDFVVNKMKAWQGSVAVSDYEGIVSPAYYVYYFLDDVFNKRYFHYLLRSCYKEEFMRLSGGIRIGQWDLSSNNLDNIILLIPPKNEQDDIVEYLDKRLPQIDSLISEKESLINDLEAYKKSLIYEVVTGKRRVV